MHRTWIILPLVLMLAGTSHGQVDTDALPKVEAGFAINFFTKEPHIINPSALCFDRQGRLFVGAGPQYRNPKPDSPTDYIKILIDEDGDGVADTVETFADGFNSIQSLAWRGDELWVANSPDLTVLRDTDGDDVADEYQVIYTGLNNLRHGLHGLNWGPDGWLYMTMGNTWVESNAPKPFRDLQGLKSKDATEYPLTKIYTRETYPKSYHSLRKREKEGGIFRCRAGGHDLELFARGMRNPWDMCMDDGFNWLATDNDPGPPGERIFMPIRHGHYSMRHPWKFDWKGHHPAVAPVADLFPTVSGSGTGVVFYDSAHFPEAYRGSYLIADWTQSCIYWYQPKWDGAHQVPAAKKTRLVRSSGGFKDLQWEGGKGRALFRPTDIEVGPDGALYIAGWGSVYGTQYVPRDKWTEEENAKYQGRVFRFRHSNPLVPRSTWDTAKRRKPLADWSIAELVADLGAQLPVWRVNAQDELIRRGPAVREKLLTSLKAGTLNDMQTTWGLWALGRIEQAANGDYVAMSALATGANLNQRVQAVRILGEHQVAGARSLLLRLLDDAQPRIRHAAIQALGSLGWGEQDRPAILASLADETDRVCGYSAWQIMRRQLSAADRRALLDDSRPGIRRMAALSLAEEGDKEIIAAIRAYLEGRKPQPKEPELPATVTVAARDLAFRGETTVTFSLRMPGSQPAAGNGRGNGTPMRAEIGTSDASVHYTLDGSTPTARSPRATGPVTLTTTTVVKAAAFVGQDRVSELAELQVRRISDAEWQDRLFVTELSDGADVLVDGAQRGVRAYADAPGETITKIPTDVAGGTLVLVPKAGGTISFHLNLAATMHVAAKAAPDGFTATGKTTETSTGATLSLFKRDVQPGTFSLPLTGPHQIYVAKATSGVNTTAAVKALLPTADLKHGEQIFFGRGTCFACHKVGDRGIEIGPGLVGIAQRRDANYVIESILEPDVYIVEGYQQTSLKLKDGRELFGMIQEETALSIKLALLTGELVTIDVAQIAKRDDAENSGMPSSFVHTLSAQDVANMTAWIMQLGNTPQASGTADGLAVAHNEAAQTVTVSIDGERFTEYRYGNKGKPILYPVIGPHGIAMTRHYPMKKGAPGEASDHPHHQSIHYNHPVSGHDFWHGRGGSQIRNDTIRSVKVADGAAVIVSDNSWVAGNGKRVLSDTTEIRAGVTEGGRYIDYQITVKATDGDIRFEDTKEGTMSIRTHPALRLTGQVATGRAINSEGVTGKAIWAKQAEWVDYWGTIDGKNVGIAIFDHPLNPRHPTTWHARDYGLIAANPFGKRHFKAGKGAMTIKNGSSATFRYRFFFHEGTHEEADIPSRYAQWHTAGVKPQFVPLFNGKDLTNFQSDCAAPFWRVEDGVLIGENDATKAGHYLWTEKDYGDFVLEFDARWQGTTQRGVDSGIEMRKPHLQLQLGTSGSLRVDMTGSFYAAGRGYPKAGRATNAKKLLNPEGTWNHFRIQARGTTFSCWINGKKASEYTDPKYAAAGPIGLQIHRGVVMKCEFRNMQIATP